MYFDTHSHITLCNHLTLGEQQALLEEKNFTYVLDPGLWVDDFMPRYEQIKNFSLDFLNKVYFGVAIAPHAIRPLNSLISSYSASFREISDEQIKEDVTPYLEKMEGFLKQRANYRIKAISEIGLDFYYTEDKMNHRVQKVLFTAQLGLAKQYDLPVFLHIRNAYSETLELVKASGVKVGAVHCFTGTERDAEAFLEWGFHLSFSGIVTFKNAQDLKEIARNTPNDRILTETDSPYLAPHPLRGQKNNSSNLVYTNRCIAELKLIEEDEWNKTLERNARKVFNI